MAIIQTRGYTAAIWTSTNPVLAAREYGVETDTLKQKVGDGVTAWNSLNYFVNPVEQTNIVTVSGATQTIPAVIVATFNSITLSAACSFTFPAAAAGKSFSLMLIAGGAFAVTWPITVKWSNGTAPTLTTTVGKIDAFSFVCVDGTNWLGFVGGKNF